MVKEFQQNNQLLYNNNFINYKNNEIKDLKKKYKYIVMENKENKESEENQNNIKKIYNTEYYKKNKDKYYKTMEQKTLCQCGSIVRYGNRSKHIKTLKHQNYMKSNNLKEIRGNFKIVNLNK